MHVLKVLHALTYVATKKDCNSRITVESLTSHTYTSSVGKILCPPILAYLRLIKINTSTKMDSDQTRGRTSQQEATRPEEIVRREFLVTTIKPFQNAFNTQLASRLNWSFLNHLPAKFCRCFRVTVRRRRIQADMSEGGDRIRHASISQKSRWPQSSNLPPGQRL